MEVKAYSRDELDSIADKGPSVQQFLLKKDVVSALHEYVDQLNAHITHLSRELDKTRAEQDKLTAERDFLTADHKAITKKHQALVAGMKKTLGLYRLSDEAKAIIGG